MDNKDTIVKTSKSWMIRKKVLDAMDNSKKVVNESEKELENANLSKADMEKGVKVLNTMNTMVTGLGKSSRGLFKRMKR